MLKRGKNERGVIEMVDTESLVPPGHLLRQVDTAVDFEKLFCHQEGEHTKNRQLLAFATWGVHR